jgi:hypothetical protein
MEPYKSVGYFVTKTGQMMPKTGIKKSDWM